MNFTPKMESFCTFFFFTPFLELNLPLENNSVTQLQNLLNLQDCKVNVKLHYQADARPMFFFLSLFSHWLSNDHAMAQL